MIRPGAWLGAPAGFPDPLYDLGYWRDLLVLVAVAAAWFESRGRRRAAVAASLVFATLAIGFWVLALGRAHGVLVEPETTRWAAGVSVAAQAGGTDGLLIGEPGPHAPWTTLIAAGVSGDLLIVAPSLLPLLVIPGLVLAAAAFGPPRSGALAAVLWAASGTGSIDALRGVGLVPGLWTRPLAGLALVVVVTAALLAARILSSRLAVAAGAAAVIIAAVAVGDPGGPGPVSTALLLTLDQGPWLIVAGMGFALHPAGPATALAGGGAIALVLALAREGSGAWLGHAAYRLGILMAAAQGLIELSGWLQRRIGSVVGAERVARFGVALVVFLALAGGFVAWWDPPRLDPIARASLEPVAPSLEEVMCWVRQNTARDSTFLASPDFAPAIAVLGGRRVLRAPGLAAATDDVRRIRTERAILQGRAVPHLVRRYRLRYVLAAPGDFREHGLVDPGDLVGRGGLREVYRSPKGMYIYEIPQ